MFGLYLTQVQNVVAQVDSTKTVQYPKLKECPHFVHFILAIQFFLGISAPSSDDLAENT